MAKICLSMTVWNDAARLSATLPSIADAVDAYAVADLGSEDSSADVVRSVFAARGVPGLVVDIPFRSFAQARNRAMEVARSSDLDFDWLFICEPGQLLVVNDPAFRDGLWADVHSVMNRSGVSFATKRLVRRGAVARFRGVTHEVLEAAGDAPTAAGISIVTVDQGDVLASARRDVALLNRGIRVEPDPMMRYCARLYSARCGEALGLPVTDLIQEYASLNNDMMHRAEAMHAIARICRLNEWWEQAFMTAEAACGIQKPRDALFLEDWIYDWGAADELCVAAYWTGRTDLCIDLCDQLLASGWLAEDDKARVAHNRALARGEIRPARAS